MLKDELMDFAIAMPKRFNKYEKSIYIEQILKRFESYGYKGKLCTFGKSKNNAKNILIGDLSQAKVILMSNYDTPSKTLLKDLKYYPFSVAENIKEEKRNLKKQVLIEIIISFLALLLLSFASGLSGFNKNLIIFFVVVLLLFFVYVLRSHANPANITRNSASIALMLDIASNKHKSVAFVLLDKNSQTNQGFEEFKSYLNSTIYSKTLKVISLDCIAYGETVVIGFNGDSKCIADDLKSLYPQMNCYCKSFSKEKCKSIGLDSFGRQVKISVGTIQNHTFYVENTRTKKDVHVNVKQMECISQMINDHIRKEML